MGFSAEWLALREPADHAARDTDLLTRAVDAAGPAPVILDLGCGTGSTVRAMKAHLPQGTQWRLVDSDRALLGRAALSAGPGASTVLLDITDLDDLPLQDVTLVTASALLDLVSAVWVEKLAARLNVPFYAALSYDGQMRWDPAMPADEGVTRAFNAHQQSDKGLGPALGPRATADSAAILERAGFKVMQADSPWHLGPQDAPLQEALVEGIATAADEAGFPGAADWGAARRAGAAASACVIGHGDLLALPAGMKGGATDATG